MVMAAALSNEAAGRNAVFTGCARPSGAMRKSTMEPCRVTPGGCATLRVTTPDSLLDSGMRMGVACTSHKARDLLCFTIWPINHLDKQVSLGMRRKRLPGHAPRSSTPSMPRRRSVFLAVANSAYASALPGL